MSEWIRQWERRWPVLECGVVRWLALALLVWVLVSVGYLLFGSKPWSVDVMGLAEGTSSKRVEHYMWTGLWWGAAINAVIGLALLGTMQWWGVMVPVGPTIETARRVYSGWARRAMLLGLGGALVVGVFERAPRLTHSFWNDEEYGFRRFVSGYHRDDGTGVLEFKRVRWVDSLFKNHDGNNHVWHTMEARAGLGVWRLLSGAEEGEFREWAVRLVPFLSGLGSIFLVGLLGSLLGRPLAGVAAAWFLALSPWHMRYAVEARGYSSMILFLLLGLVFLVKALQTGSWRWWLFYGAAQCLMLWSFAGVVYVALVQNILALAFLLMNNRWKGNRQGIIGRFFVANALSAGVFLVLMLPSLMQLVSFLEGYQEETGRVDLGAGFLRDVWAHLVVGLPWTTAGDESWPSMIGLQAKSLGAFIFLNVVMPVAAVLGALLMLFRGDWRARLVALVFLLAAVAMWGHNALSGTAIMGWYFVFFAPGFALFLGWGSALVWAESFRVRGGVAVAIVALFWLTASGPRGAIRDRERHPMRQVVWEVRGESPAVTADDEGIMTVAMGSGDRQLRTYDPWIHPVDTKEELEVVMEEARDRGKDLAVYVCSPLRLEREAPEVMAMLRDEGEFEKRREVDGLEEFWSFRVWERAKR
ncbi:MAG: glycosyltransferase family 39 protein [Verrucomicrobiota bacterium]